MDRRALLMGLAAAVVAGATSTAGLAFAADPAQQIIDRLKADGFRNIASARTFIGRVRITATKGAQSREVVIDPRTGEILRDLTRGADGASGGSGSSGSGGNSGSGGSGSSDDGSEDGDDSGGSGGSGGDDDGSDDDGSDDSGSGSDDSGSDDSGSDSGSDSGGSDDD